MQDPILSCREAKRKDLVDYLASLRLHPQKIKGADHWYLSPLREEKTPSFKVNRKFNVWYDHGIGKGGNLIDFGILYHQCSVAELLRKLSGLSSFQQPLPDRLGEPFPTPRPAPAEEEKKLRILSVSEIQSPDLIQYLNTRKISVELARTYCQKVDFELYGKTFTALGFPNRSGGYELRNATFKGSSSPKDISLIDIGQDQVAVFEGFFSFLSFQTIAQQQSLPPTNYLVLNSLAFLEKARADLERYGEIHLYLDRDLAGTRNTEKALQWSPRYQDRSQLYAGHKDLNDFLQAHDLTYRQTQRPYRHR